MKESALKQKMARRIRDRGGWARSIPSGPAGAGLPDIMFFYRGYGGGIEVKLPGKEGNLTKLQAETLRGIRSGGGVGVMFTQVSQVDALILKIDKLKDRKKGK